MATKSGEEPPGGREGPLSMAFFGDLVRCETRLYNAFNDELRTAHGIVTSQFEFLRYLRDHEGARVADLAAEFAVGVGAISKSMDRLEKRGWVIRRPNPEDRRSAILVLTDDGRALADAAEQTFQGRLDQILAAATTPEQLAGAAGTLAALRAALERDNLGTPTG
ncbi:MAG TPA: MarR family transcriptional regulator [Streptosporangiaceae bacterium]|nr:MarR family transcriptional regulator [Streptosporangiaceae bacterium]